MLIPVILFMLGLPNKPPQAISKDVHMDMTQEAMGYAQIVTLGPAPLAMLGAAAGLRADESAEEPIPRDFRQLEAIAGKADARAEWKGKRVEVRGQYVPGRGNDRVFRLVRYRIGCCAADAIELEVPVVTAEPIQGLAANDWAKVVGKLDFIEQNGNQVSVIRVSRRGNVELCQRDLNPYVQ